MLTFLFTFQDSDLQCFQPQFTDIITLQSERKLSLKIIGPGPLVFEETVSMRESFTLRTVFNLICQVKAR